MRIDRRETFMAFITGESRRGPSHEGKWLEKGKAIYESVSKFAPFRGVKVTRGKFVGHLLGKAKVELILHERVKYSPETRAGRNY